MKHYALFLSLLCGLILGCQGRETIETREDVSYRTYYDSLRLETPESAIETFVEAFQRRDFATVYMVLAPASQQRIQLNTRLLISEGIAREGVATPPSEEFHAALMDKLFNSEHIVDALHRTDQLLNVAAEYGVLQIYLPGAVSIVGSTSSINSLEQTVLDVITKVEGIDGEVIFRLAQSPRGKWRVLQVIWPGGDPAEIPWAIQPNYTGGSVHKTSVDGARTYYDSLDLDNPEAAVRTFTEAFKRQDFPTVYWILHPRTQTRWGIEFSMVRIENILKMENDSYRQLVESTEPLQNWRALDEAGVDSRLMDSGVISQSDSPFAVMYTYSQESAYASLIAEHMGDWSYLFDQIMLAAADQYLIDLRQPVTIVNTVYLESPEDGLIALVSTLLEGTEGEVIFRLKQAPSGRWRVLQVIAPGGDEMLYPWAAPRVAD